MRYTISKDFAFSASHQLDGLPEDHPCSRLHGHNIIVRVELQASFLHQPGFILDYREMEPFKKYIDDELDHRHLNDIVDFNPTAELMTQFLYKKIRYEYGWPVSSVGWSETPKTWAFYSERMSS